MANPLHGLLQSAAPDPLECIRLVGAHLERNQDAPQPAANFVVRGINDYLAGRGCLDSCLKLRGLPGKPDARKRALRAARDRLICEGLRVCGGTLADAAARLNEALMSHETASAELGRVVAEIRAMAGVRRALSARQILRIASAAGLALDASAPEFVTCDQPGKVVAHELLPPSRPGAASTATNAAQAAPGASA